MIKFDNVNKVYSNGLHALKNVSLEIKQGEFVAIIGLSGAGKSTLLRTINRMHDISEGSLTVNGQEVNDLSGKDLRKFRRKVGMVFQSFNLVTRTTVINNVLTSRVPDMPLWKSIIGLYSKEDKVIALEALDKVGILDKAYVRADQLSGGQQQRVALARTLAQKPEIILADEPVAALDPITAKQVMDDFKKINKELNMSVLINIHHVDLALKYADRVIGIKAGEIDEFEKQESNNALENADMELLNPDNSEKKPPIFRFNNIRTNTKAPKGFAFLNTDPDKKARIQEGDMVNITFYITFRNSIPQADLTLDAFDFFIAKPVKEKASQWQEIHTRGYAPTEEFGQNVYEQTKEGNSYIGKSSIYYTSNSNLIWAINVPTDIPHAYEKADFLEAYPHFKDWATSGGNQNKDWYENTTGNRNDSYLIKQ